MNYMKKLQPILLILMLAVSVFPCGIPTTIAGHVDTFAPGKMTLANNEGVVVETIFSSPFGYFMFQPVLACDAPFTIQVYSKSGFFESPMIDAGDFDKANGFIWIEIQRIN